MTTLLVAIGGTLASDFAKSLHPLLGNADGVSFDNGRDLARLLGDLGRQGQCLGHLAVVHPVEEMAVVDQEVGPTVVAVGDHSGREI